MTREDIMNLIPHRDVMLLVDEAEVIGDEAHGRYHVTGDEWFLKGHFPGNPVVPGVVLCEMMGQATSVLLAGKKELEGSTPLLTGLNNVRFRQNVLPGDTLETVSEITKVKGPFYFAKGKGYVNGKLCVEGDFSFAIRRG